MKQNFLAFSKDAGDAGRKVKSPLPSSPPQNAPSVNCVREKEGERERERESRHKAGFLLSSANGSLWGERLHEPQGS